MMQLTLSQIHQWLPGSMLRGDAKTVVARVHSDSRTVQHGDLFVALRGERFDANDYLGQALQQGAAAALAHHGRLPVGMQGVEVADSRQALGSLAAAWRAQFQLPLIAVSGSNGKTTVTQMIAAILRAWQPERYLATAGNFNNHIGVPLTLLRLRAQDRAAVVELGMNHPGELAALAQMARPTVALVNNAQREHQEFMSSVEAVARENGSVFDALPADGVAVFPQADAFTGLWQQLAGARRCISFGAPGAQVALDSATWQAHGCWQAVASTPVGPLEFSLRIAGRHNLRNALAALSCALAAGVPAAAAVQGLQNFEPVWGRSRAIALSLGGRALTLVDDAYNANPDSVLAAINVLAELPGPQLLVLGDMGEVGVQGPRFHAEVGDHARTCGIAHLFTLGDAAVAMGGRHFSSIDALNAAVLAALPGVRSVLVKGSRFMKMERVVQHITAHAQQETVHVG